MPQLVLRAKGFWLALICAVAFVAYLPLLGSYYCGFDDFTEIYKAAFEDNDSPSRMFTTTHQGTPKYRPLNRALTWATYRLGEGAAGVYRMRNLAGHVLCAYAIFQLASLGGQSVAGAGLTALAFAVHPLAHQTVAAASWTNSSAYAAALWSWYLLASAWGLKRPLRRILGGSVLLLAALFSYEATIVIAGPMALTLAWRRWRKESPAAGWPALAVPLAAGVAGAIACLFVARSIFVGGRMPMTPPLIIVKNLALYLGSMTLPVDLLLLNSWVGLPLPSQLASNPSSLAVLGLLCLAPLIAAGLLWVYARRQAQPSTIWLWIWLATIPMALSPFLINTDHASETYLYLAVAALCLLVGGALERWIQPRPAVAVAAVFLALALPGTWARSGRVSACAATASEILKSLPLDSWRTGQPLLYFSDEDGYVQPPRFGLYNTHGLGTIDVQADNVPVLQSALRVATGNLALNARALGAGDFAQACLNPLAECYKVSGRGVVRRQAGR